MYNIDTQEQVAVYMCDFDRIWRGNCFTGEPIGRAEVDVTGKDEITVEMIKGGGDRVFNWIWKLYNMTFENGVAEDWRSAVIIPLYKGKGKKTDHKNYRGISLFSVVGKIYVRILKGRVCRVTGDEQRGFKAGREYVDQILTLKQIGEKVQ